MPDHVNKILNRAYLEDETYNDIALHLEQEMRLNGLGAPDETTLVPLNAVDAPVTADKKEQPQRAIISTVANTATTKRSAIVSEKNATIRPGQILPKQTRLKHQNPTLICVEKGIKLKIAGRELTRQMTHERKNENLPSQPTKSVNSQCRPLLSAKKLKSPTLWGNL